MNESKEETRTRWQHMEEIYHAALPIAAIERLAFVMQSCAGDTDLQKEIISLLASDDAMADFLQEPVAELGLAALADESELDSETITQPVQPASDDLIGMKIANRYEVIKRLGGGGFGDVYKAADTKILSRPVVIKVLKEDVLREEGPKRDWIVTKFHQEIEALSKIHDVGIIGIFDADTLPNGRPYIVMEFVEGTDLRSFINQARQEGMTDQELRFQDVADIVKQVGRALTEAHETGIFHRDLKPENIMLRRNTSGDLQVKVIDFGVAKVRNSIIASSAATNMFGAGTWKYMAPEQLQGKKVSAACDIYALGVIAYEMVTGRCPFAAKNYARLLSLQEAGVKVNPCDLNTDLPIAAQEAILKALSYYPTERQNRARDFGDQLASAFNADEELARPVTSAPLNSEEETVIKPREIAPASGLHLYRRWVLAALAMLIAGLIVFTAWWALKAPDSQSQQLPATTPVAGPEHTLTYWLTVQRKQDKEPFPSIGEKIFDAGSKFRLNIQNPQAGALYIFSEGKNENDITEWNTMFPTTANNESDPWLQANSGNSLRTEEYTFEDGRGMIKVWIIWARQRQPVLDDIVRRSVKRAFPNQGIVSEAEQLQAFIKQHSMPQPEILLDKEKFRVTLKGSSDILLDLRELEYQP